MIYSHYFTSFSRKVSFTFLASFLDIFIYFCHPKITFFFPLPLKCSRIWWEIVWQARYWFLPAQMYIFIFVLVSFFVTLLFIIFSNRNRINSSIAVFLFWRKIISSAIAPVIRFFLEIVSCYFKISCYFKFAFLIILIFALTDFFLLFIVL